MKAEKVIAAAGFLFGVAVIGTLLSWQVDFPTFDKWWIAIPSFIFGAVAGWLFSFIEKKLGLKETIGLSTFTIAFAVMFIFSTIMLFTLPNAFIAPIVLGFFVAVMAYS